MKIEDRIQQYRKTDRLGERRTTLQLSVSLHILVVAYARKHDLSVRDATERLISAGLALEERVI